MGKKGAAGGGEDILPLRGSAEAGPGPASRVVYIGHIPHGFYEDAMISYFSQFGKLTKVRLSRSRKTGNSKGYAFLEFASAEVAEIAAEAMHNYMMFGQRLVCRVVPADQQHPNLWKGANRKFKKVPWQKISADKHNRVRTPEEEVERIRKLVYKDNVRKRKLQEAGIDYEYEGLAEQRDKSRGKKIVFS